MAGKKKRGYPLLTVERIRENAARLNKIAATMLTIADKFEAGGIEETEACKKALEKALRNVETRHKAFRAAAQQLLDSKGD